MLHNFHYCPKCGEPEVQFGNHRFFCSACHWVYFHNTASSVAVLLRYSDEILFTIRNQEPKKGLWDLPGGFCDYDENAEETCKREIFEELRLDISNHSIRYLASLPNSYPYKEVEYRTLDLFFEVLLEEKPAFEIEKDEIIEVVWVKISEIEINKIAFDSQKKFFKTFDLRA